MGYRGLNTEPKILTLNSWQFGSGEGGLEPPLPASQEGQRWV